MNTVEIVVPKLDGPADEVIYLPRKFGRPGEEEYHSLDRRSFMAAYEHISSDPQLCQEIDDFAVRSIELLIAGAVSSPGPFAATDRIVKSFPLAVRASAVAIAYVYTSEMIYLVAKEQPKTKEIEKRGCVKFVERTGGK